MTAREEERCSQPRGLVALALGMLRLSSQCCSGLNICNHVTNGWSSKKTY